MENLLAEALDLPEDERARLAHELLCSLDEEGTERADQVLPAWTGELTRRLEDVREGNVSLVELDDVELYVAQRLAAVRQ